MEGKGDRGLERGDAHGLLNRGLGIIAVAGDDGVLDGLAFFVLHA